MEKRKKFMEILLILAQQLDIPGNLTTLLQLDCCDIILSQALLLWVKATNKELISRMHCFK